MEATFRVHGLPILWLETNLGMHSGVIMSTGHVWQSGGPNNSASVSSNATICNEYLDPSLSTINNNPAKHDASTLELDLYPKVIP